VVADELGNMFSKETLLTALVEKTLPPEFEHIRGMRDVIELKFHNNPDAPTKGVDIDWSTDTWSPYSCPVANVEMNGRYPFVAIRRSVNKGGAAADDERVNVISEKALKEVGAAALQDEYGPFDAETDIVKLVPSDVERLEMIKQLSERRALEKAEKKKRKAEKLKNGGGGEGEVKVDASSGSKKSKDSSSVKSAPKPSVSSQATKNFLGVVKTATAKSLDDYGKSNSTFNKLFHGAGSQKPASAKDQFIVQSGKRGIIG
jgi:hypothetical protein